MKQTSNRQHNIVHRCKHGYDWLACPLCDADYLAQHGRDRHAHVFQTTLAPMERADLRFILKQASQNPFVLKDTRTLAMRLLEELDQLPLEF